MRSVGGLPGIPNDNVPVDYDIEDGVLVVNVRGRTTALEFGRYLDETARDPRYRPDLSRLLLLADDTTFPSSATIIHYAGKMAERKLDPSVRFACVARTPLTIGIASMFMGNAGLGDSYQVFDTEAKARAWLASTA